MRKSKRRNLASIGRLLIISPLTLPAAFAQTNGAQLEEVVVTARKRAESIQDIPMSVSAYSGADLAAAAIHDFKDLAARVPGVSMQNGGAGYRTVYVRGISTEIGSAATTGLYIDETYVEPAGIVRTIVEPNYFDVDHVEVLRGPQGTIFGGSSMGGTIRVINREPDPSTLSSAFGSEVSATRDGDINYRVDGMLNLPLSDEKAALRSVVSYSELGGFVDRLVGDFSGPGRSAVGPVRRQEDSDGQTSLNARVSLGLYPTETLSLTPTFQYIKSRSDNFSAIDIEGSNTSGLRQSKHYADLQEPLDDVTRIASLTAKLDLGFAELLSATSHVRREASFVEDLTNNFIDTYQPSVVEPFLQFLADPSFTFPAGLWFPSRGVGESREKTWQQELRLTSNGEQALQYVLGVYYEDRTTNGEYDLRLQGFDDYFNGLGTPTGAAIATFAPADNFYTAGTEGTRRQYAVFGETSYQILRSLKLSVGARYYDYKSGQKTYDYDGLLNGGALPDATNPAARESGWSPRVSLAYAPTEDLNFYAQVAKGFRPGAPNYRVNAASCGEDLAGAGITFTAEGDIPGFKSDEIWNSEVGAKMQFLDKRLTLNQAFYRMDWSDIQSFVLLPTCGFGYVANAGEARVYGSETELLARPTDNLSLSATLNYTRAELMQDSPATGGVKGDQLPSVPEWSASANIEYSFDVTDRTRGHAIVSYSYVDESFRDFLNRPGRNALIPGLDVGARRSNDAYSMVNARLGVTRNNWTASLFVNNVFDVDPRIFWFASSFSYSQSFDRLFVPQPRTIGIGVRADF
jgi:iron complex outermembrane recepter protein